MVNVFQKTFPLLKYSPSPPSLLKFKLLSVAALRSLLANSSSSVTIILKLALQNNTSFRSTTLDPYLSPM